jgi:hypothetical protein
MPGLDSIYRARQNGEKEERGMELYVTAAYDGVMLHLDGKTPTARLYLDDEDAEQLQRHCELALAGHRAERGQPWPTDLDDHEDWCEYYREKLGYHLYGMADHFALSHGDLEVYLNRAQVEDLLQQLKRARTENWLSYQDDDERLAEAERELDEIARQRAT